MKSIIIEINSILSVDLSIKSFPELKSKKKFVQKAINIVKRKTPKIYRYLSKENAIINLKNYRIIIEHSKTIRDDEVEKILKYWIERVKIKRIIYSLFELLVIPFTAILTPIPGPNFVFYALFLLFYFHFSGYLSLRKIKIEELNIEMNNENLR